MRFAVINTVPPGFCRKMHLLAPGGRLEDLAELKRDDLSEAGLSPTHMEAIEGFVEWRDHGVPPAVGLLMWYLESTQLPSGAFLRTPDAPSPSIGVVIRYLQIAGTLGITRGDCDSVDRAVNWLEGQVGDDGLIRQPISGNVDYGMLARGIRSLRSVYHPDDGSSALERGCVALAKARLGGSIWSTYPEGNPSAGATSLAIAAVSDCEELFDFAPDPTWLLEIRNPDGGWGEFEGSPSKTDNTFWTGRACKIAGVELGSVDRELTTLKDRTNYEIAMAHRLSVLLDQNPGEQVTDLAMRSLNDDADRYAETVLYGLALAETSTAAWSKADERLPVQTPDFLRREPPLYDQLGQVSDRSWWLGLVNRAAQVRAAEASIGWMAGLWAAIALISEEFVNGLAALPLIPLLLLVALEALLAAGWLAARQMSSRPLAGLSHLSLACGLAVLLVLLLTGPGDSDLTVLPGIALTALLALVVEVVSVATDKADLLNRLGDD